MSANTMVLFIGTVVSAMYIMRKFVSLFLSVLAIVVLYMAWKRLDKREPFIGFYHGVMSANDDIVPCNVYYTANSKECDDGMYFQTIEEVNEALRSPHLSVQERASLQKVKNDMDMGLPFPHLCKTRFGTWKQLKSHPKKNGATAGENHGHPNTYAYCYHNHDLSRFSKIHVNKSNFKINNTNNYRYDFQTLDFDQLKNDFCSQYVVPQADLQKLSTFHKKWVLALKINKNDGTILDIRSMALNYQDLVPYSNLYEAAKNLFQLRVENNNAIFGANPYSYTSLRIFKNHCGKIANVSLREVALNNVLPIPYTIIMSPQQISNAYGITMQELVNDVDKPISFDTTCPFTNGGNVRCPGDGAIYYIDGKRKRWYSSQSYAHHQNPRYTNVDCTMLRNYCPNGTAMPSAAQDRAMFFEHNNYTGKSATLGPGDYNWVASFGIGNDSISSMVVQKDIDVQVFKDAHFGGQSTWFRGPGNWSSMPLGWNDHISSFKIRRK
jgi:hypothetical protein